NFGLGWPTHGAVVEHYRKIIAGIPYIETRADATGDTCDGQLQRARIGLGHDISRYHHLPPALPTTSFQHLQGNINLGSNGACDNPHGKDSPPAQLGKEVRLKKRLFIMHKASEIRQVTRGSTEALAQFSSSPVQLVIDIANHRV